VTVEHVNVHAGGQAILGAVDATGESTQKKPEEQPHALTHAPGIPLRSASLQEPEPEPAISDEKRPPAAIPDDD
jgi:hypothetical protein